MKKKLKNYTSSDLEAEKLTNSWIFSFGPNSVISGFATLEEIEIRSDLDCSFFRKAMACDLAFWLKTLRRKFGGSRIRSEAG